MIKHLACIMDGNRRWAKKNGLLPWKGHEQGMRSVEQVINFCLEKKINYLSLYTFSTENINRPTQELDFLFNTILKKIAESYLPDFIQKGLHIRFIGDQNLFPSSVQQHCNIIENATKNGKNLQVNILFGYGARQEIIEAAKKLALSIKENKVQYDTVTTEYFEGLLWTAGIPEPELIIRTGGAQRLSNFLLYQAAYSEFYFLDCLWPEITPAHLATALSYFEQCKRNFGV